MKQEPGIESAKESSSPNPREEVRRLIEEATIARPRILAKLAAKSSGPNNRDQIDLPTSGEARKPRHEGTNTCVVDFSPGSKKPFTSII